MIEIPEQLRKEEFRFIILADKKKFPVEKEWQIKNNYKFNDPKLLNHLKNDGNYGIIGGYGGLIIVDDDSGLIEEIINDSDIQDTFTVKTGSGKKHFYYICPELKENIKLNAHEKQWGDVQVSNKFVVAPGSTHPNGNKYEIFNHYNILEINAGHLLELLKKFIPEKEINEEEKKVEEENKLGLSIGDFIDLNSLTKRGNEYCGEHPIHGSSGGINFWVNPNKNTWHCFRCDSGGGALSWIAVKEKIIKCSESKRGALKGEIFIKVLNTLEEKYGIKIERKSDHLLDSFNQFTDYIKIARDFIKNHPIYYDDGKNWWIWDHSRKCYVLKDETDLLIAIDSQTKNPSVNSKVKNEILEALRRVGRMNKPKEANSAWVQFKEKIIDIKSGQEFEATPEYFITNPIPHDIGDSEETPTMDKLFEEWVGKKYVRTLYEILAYCLLSDYPIHRIFCMYGDGLNGKSCFLRLLKRFIGISNCTSTELELLFGSRFEITRLHKKLVCLMTETDFEAMSKTAIIKKLTGQDLIGFERKNRDPFEDMNYAKLIISTNNLPPTDDKTTGFYRRWMIIDFPNQFEEGNDILETISEEEYKNLANKCIKILKNVLEIGKFTNEGTVEERMKRYEEKSNPFDKFMKENVEEDFDGFIFKFHWKQRFDEWCKEHKFRLMSDTTIHKKMKDLGIETAKRESWWLSDGAKKWYRAWIGIKWGLKSSFNPKISTLSTTSTQSDLDLHTREMKLDRVEKMEKMEVRLINSPQEMKVAKNGHFSTQIKPNNFAKNDVKKIVKPNNSEEENEVEKVEVEKLE